MIVLATVPHLYRCFWSSLRTNSHLESKSLLVIALRTGQCRPCSTSNSYRATCREPPSGRYGSPAAHNPTFVIALPPETDAAGTENTTAFIIERQRLRRVRRVSVSYFFFEKREPAFPSSNAVFLENGTHRPGRNRAIKRMMEMLPTPSPRAAIP